MVTLGPQYCGVVLPEVRRTARRKPPEARSTAAQGSQYCAAVPAGLGYCVAVRAASPGVLRDGAALAVPHGGA